MSETFITFELLLIDKSSAPSPNLSPRTQLLVACKQPRKSALSYVPSFLTTIPQQILYPFTTRAEGMGPFSELVSDPITIPLDLKSFNAFSTGSLDGSISLARFANPLTALLSFSI